jgi:hypothetical protein
VKNIMGDKTGFQVVTMAESHHDNRKPDSLVYGLPER